MAVSLDDLPAPNLPAPKATGLSLDDLPAPLPVDRKNGGALQTAGNILAGGLRGAGSIGATILAPYDMGKDALAGKGLSLESNRQRRKDMDSALNLMGAQPDSMAYQGGKIATEIAGTLPVGGLLGKAAGAAGATPKVVSALNSGGFTLGSPAAATVGGRLADLALRAGAGAATGGATTALIDPDQATEGAVLGAALPAGIRAAGAAGRGARKALGGTAAHALGATTGAGADAVKEAYRAGKAGSKTFLDNLRGDASFDDVVAEAKRGLASMRADRQAAYRGGMVDIKNDKTVLDFTPIEKELGDLKNLGSFKGVAIRKKAADIVDDITATVEEWRALDPAEYHTPEGFDALKQSIGDIRDATQFGTPARRAADQMYNAVKSQITSQAPAYAKVMDDYSKASSELSEIEQALSVGNRPSKDTAVRKLQSLMRNNAQTSYGNRLNLAKTLSEKGGADILPAVAGQALNSWTPRGMVGAIEKAGLAGAGVGTFAGYTSPALLAAAPLTSPRLVGEAAYGLGRGAGRVQDAGSAMIDPIRGLLMQQPAQQSLGLLGRAAAPLSAATLESRR